MTETKPDTLYGAILRVQTEIPRLKLGRDAEGQIGSRKYKYLTLDKLHAEILPVLTRNGLSWITKPEGTVDEPVLTYRLICPADPDGREIEGTMPLMLGDDRTSQAYGSALSYAARYALLRVLGIAPSGEDDDGAAASKRVPKPAGEVTKEVRKKKDEADRPLNDEELGVVMKAMAGVKDKDMLLRSVGCDDLALLTVFQGREIMRKVGKPAEVSAK